MVVASYEQVKDPQATDYSNSFSLIRTTLTDEQGMRYIEFVRTLEPKYGRVMLDIGLGYVAIAAALALVWYGGRVGISPIILVAGGGAAIGYAAHFLSLFLHEAAHWNIAGDREWNDRTCNLLVSGLLGTDVKKYRRVHFPHHRFLGTVQDPERSYFNALNLPYVILSLTGVRALRVFLHHRRTSSSAGPVGKTALKETISQVAVPVVGALAHVAIIGLLGFFVSPWAALAWIVGYGCFFPFFASLRQLLEHRAFGSPNIDYSAVDHGAHARIFHGLISESFGGAGFNRHLLHHWEPQVSYTRLADLEKFLERTSMRAVMDSRRMTYSQAFFRLFSFR